MGKRKTIEQFIIESINIHGDKYDYDVSIYKNAHTKIWIWCHGCQDYFKQLPYEHTKGSGCRRCANINNGKNKRKTTEQFTQEAILIHGKRYDYSMVKYVKSDIYIDIICNTCNYVFNQTPSSHLEGMGCPSCANNKRKTTEQFTQEAILIHGKRYDYSMVDYIDNKTKITIICRIHGEFSQLPYVHLKPCGCPKCNSSKGELLIEKYLIDNGINFVPQKRFKECKDKRQLPFDFYLPDINMCIEFDGEQHFIPFMRWGGKEKLKIIQKRDKIKNEYCEYNNIRLLRVKYNDDIIGKLKTHLS